MNERAKQRRLDLILMSDPHPVILENWARQSCDGRDYLEGDVHGHQRIADGTRIRTSRIMWLLDDPGIAQTATMNYILRNRR